MEAVLYDRAVFEEAFQLTWTDARAIGQSDGLLSRDVLKSADTLSYAHVSKFQLFVEFAYI